MLFFKLNLNQFNCNNVKCLISGVVLLALCVSRGQGRINPSADKQYYGRLIGTLKDYAHNIRGTVYATDENTLFIKSFSYDGTGPDAYFWVGKSARPSPEGIIVPYPEGNYQRDPPVLKAYQKADIIFKLPNGMRIKDIKWLSVWCRRFTRIYAEQIDPYISSLEPLKGYQGEDIEIQLPGNLTVYDIDWLAMWCVQYRHNFGHVMIPRDLDVPPALGQTKITPPWWYKPTSSTTETPEDLDQVTNCREFLNERMQVQWSLKEDYVQIKLSAVIRDDQYMAFGLSGEEGRSTLVNFGDIFIPPNLDVPRPRVLPEFKRLAHGLRSGNITILDARTFYIPNLHYDGAGPDAYFWVGNGSEPSPLGIKVPNEIGRTVIAAIGPLNSRKEANAHAIPDKTVEDIKIDFSSTNDHSCVVSLTDVPEDPSLEPWTPAVITHETMFTARIGPTGGKRGYTPITGHPSWGIAWYINDMLIPEIYVERGQTYTFVVEGGNEPAQPARYHPFYITDSSEGGYGQKSETEQRQQRVFAGVNFDSEGYPFPSAAGRYCEWVHKTIDRSSETASFEDYFLTLRLDCQPGEPAYLNWTVAQETPDLVYYQVR
ncbi:protein Skeletor, isoforms B/C [Diaphorina citri]|uniref:Protein Skeletor, isoforms B/C n=1 Tax=Diaphorina citri TaxID=121845 RepID=A0A3Q0IR62_DIACI|nr:protein Skeletor, isoforms B/C [Diaphorina citri]